MEIKARTLLFGITGANSMATKSLNNKLIRLSELVGVKIVGDTILEIHTKDSDNNIDFDLVDITELYALKRQIKQAINKQQAIIAVMQQLKVLRDLGVDEIDISGYHLSTIEECTTNIT